MWILCLWQISIGPFQNNIITWPYKLFVVWILCLWRILTVCSLTSLFSFWNSEFISFFPCLLCVQVSLHAEFCLTCGICASMCSLLYWVLYVFFPKSWYLEILRRFWARDEKCHNEWCTGDGNIVWHWGEEWAFSAVGHTNIRCATEDELLCEYIMFLVYVDLSFSPLRADTKDDRMMSLIIS